MVKKEDINKLIGIASGFITLSRMFDTQKPRYIKPPIEEAPKPRYQATISPEGRFVLTIDDLLIDEWLHSQLNKNGNYAESLKDRLFFGSFLDSPYFKKSEDRYGKWLTDPQKEILSRFEEDVQQDFKLLKQRRNSGLPAISHVYSDKIEVLKIALRAGVPPDYIIAIGSLGHDLIEEDDEIKDLEDKRLEALLKDSQDDMLRYSTLLTKARKEKSTEVERRLNGYIPIGVRGDERDDYRTSHSKAVRIILDTTRFTERNPYAYSLEHSFSIDGSEGLDQTFRRFVVKGSDLISNSGETDPIPEEVMKQLRTASMDEGTVRGNFDGHEISYVIRDEFQRRFGSLKENGEPMSSALRVANSVNGVPALQYANETLNNKAEDVSSGIINGTTPQLMRLAIYTMNEVANAKLSLAYSAIKRYEQYPEVMAAKPQIDAKIERLKKTSHYDTITFKDGIVGHWLELDEEGRERIDKLDQDPNERVESYEAARHLEVLLPRFTMVYNKPNNQSRQLVSLEDLSHYNPHKHEFFTLKNFDLVKRSLANHEQRVKDYTGL
ncbi:hypothetical protein HYW20_00675 [Candidatus Woesearchaeota archaeon]|nr:hypothetical protein [Candidatus Woesearchaeota archaeon]